MSWFSSMATARHGWSKPDAEPNEAMTPGRAIRLPLPV
jgi:hypothetical protein